MKQRLQTSLMTSSATLSPVPKRIGGMVSLGEGGGGVRKKGIGEVEGRLERI
jgi:hypothetical protein